MGWGYGGAKRECEQVIGGVAKTRVTSLYTPLGKQTSWLAYPLSQSRDLPLQCTSVFVFSANLGRHSDVILGNTPVAAACS